MHRAVYHGDPASPKAMPASRRLPICWLKAGPRLQDEKPRGAIGQYEFRVSSTRSHYRFSALLTEGEIYRHDLEDRDEAKATFSSF